MLTGEFQLNWMVAPGIGLMMFARAGAGPKLAPHALRRPGRYPLPEAVCAGQPVAVPVAVPLPR